MQPAKLVLILSGFPRRSETFALHEATALHRRGLLTAIFATKAGDGLPPQPGSEALLDVVRYLPAGNAEAQADALMQALNGQPIGGVHAYFAHQPTEVAMVVAKHLQVPYGFSMHAKDARKVTPAELNERARGAACVVACNPDVAKAVTDPAVRVSLLPHGVDIDRFHPQPLTNHWPLRLLAVGRLVEKKGFDILLRAAARLTFPWTLEIIGDGPERSRLAQLREALGITDKVHLRSGITHEELPAAYHAAHVVVVPSVIDRSGDRDGLPNVLLEAMAAGRPVVASDVSAIGSAVVSGENGLLVQPGDVAALAAALARLARQPELGRDLGRRARQRMAFHYDLRTCSDRFCDFIEQTYFPHAVATSRSFVLER
ncbi:MAG: glycosyltransferase [Caldilineaceae bacterium]|nr:glycosyltransferase [Caldilineaceae bacterium]MCB0184192.1 glycosyltransferase [Caldilineaceae bacterium]